MNLFLLRNFFKDQWRRYWLLIITLITIVICSSAAVAYPVDRNQIVHLKIGTMSVRDIFREVRLQAGYDVIWQSKRFNADRIMSITVNSISMLDLLNICVDKNSYKYLIADKSIVITPIDKVTSIQRQDSLIYSGQIVDEKGKALSGATIKVVGSKKATSTNTNGMFSILGPKKGTLEITYIGYLNRNITLNGLTTSSNINVRMTPGTNTLGEVNVVSTGYQDLPKERATGSFEVITKEQLQHSTDPNLIKRLEGITTSMNFNNNLISNNSTYSPVAPTDPEKSPLATLTIRGKNTLNSTLVNFNNQSGQVLVIIDGIASPYPIDNVNPDDVENITVLKDAAAASIWGSRASNGVIVIKTKRGLTNQPINISFNTNFNLTEKFDLFYPKRMSVSDYIDAQISQFNANGTQVSAPNLNFAQRSLSPVAEILGQQKNGLINSSQAKARIDSLRAYDVRKDFDKYVLQNALSQNHSLSISGGTRYVAYRIAGSYSKEEGTNRFSGGDRVGVTLNTTFKPIKNLSISPGLSYFIRRSHNQATEQVLDVSQSGGTFLPYTRLVDNEGNALSIPYKYRQAFKDLLTSTYGDFVKDLNYVPLENVNEGFYKTSYKDLNLNVGTTYVINEYLSANAIFNYTLGDSDRNRLNSMNSFYMRDLVTFFTTRNGLRNIPEGGTYRTSNTKSTSVTGRVQLDYNRDINAANSITVLAGAEITQNRFLTKNFQYYGYDENTLRINNEMNFKDRVTTLWFSEFFSPTSKIPWQQPLLSDGTIRTLSVFSNAAYTFRKLYTLSASVRKDMSSQFGIGTNKGGTPFYSLGVKWNLGNETFYDITWLPVLQLRATFGYNGNVNPLISGKPIIGYGSNSAETNLPIAVFQPGGVSNRLLRPERTKTLNSGIDFGFKNGKITGSLEYYDRRTFDLIASNAIDPSSGFSQTTYNTANIHAWGSDLTINTQNLRAGKFSWFTTLLASYNRVKLAKIYTPQAQSALDVVTGGYNEGADLSRIYGYRWAGLDPLTGDPRGFVNGQPKTITGSFQNYLEVVGQPLSTARYFGSIVPVYFGSVRNSFSYGSFAASVNVLYKLGYYFRRNSVNLVSYGQLFNRSGLNFIQGAEYSQRWRNPGDENFTNVPSLVYQTDGYRDDFYQYSEINVLKGDHIRLQEINFSYNIGKKNWLLKNPRLYANISNLGVILWRENSLGLDPDTYDYPTPRTYSLGFSANF